MASRSSGHKRGLGSTVVVLVLLAVGAGAGLHYTAAVGGVFRATMGVPGSTPEELTLDVDREWVERNGVAYLRIAVRRDYLVFGLVTTDETWDRARLTRLRTENPRLAALDCWPDPEAPDGGVVWVRDRP